MAVTVEPGVYLAVRGGVRIGDTLVVCSGAAELRMLTTKEFVAIQAAAQMAKRSTRAPELVARVWAHRKPQ